MSQGYTGAGAEPYVESSGERSSTVEPAKHEAGEVMDSATNAAKDVAEVAKDEVAGVAHETTLQVRDLFEQSRDEMRDQAARQQQRIATGLTSVGDELRSMASSSSGSGIAGELVQRVSDRVGAAGSWLADRDPAAVLSEVKAFARRRPGVFIAVGVLAGVVAGRLVRAMASNEAASSSGGSSRVTPGSTRAAMAPSLSESEASGHSMQVPASDAPIYSQSASRFEGGGMESADERSDSL
jgi:hypothetical protein